MSRLVFDLGVLAGKMVRKNVMTPILPEAVLAFALNVGRGTPPCTPKQSLDGSQQSKEQGLHQPRRSRQDHLIPIRTHRHRYLQWVRQSRLAVYLAVLGQTEERLEEALCPERGPELHKHVRL